MFHQRRFGLIVRRGMCGLRAEAAHLSPRRPRAWAGAGTCRRQGASDLAQHSIPQGPGAVVDAVTALFSAKHHAIGQGTGQAVLYRTAASSRHARTTRRSHPSVGHLRRRQGSRTNRDPHCTPAWRRNRGRLSEHRIRTHIQSVSVWIVHKVVGRGMECSAVPWCR